jgi:hypothetical protein
MAGFNLSKTVEAEKKNLIEIPLVVNIFYEDKDANGNDITPEVLTVTHIFRIPERSEREKHQSMQVKVRGQNLKALGTTAANFWLWSQCMVELKGYEDLPSTREQIIKMFEESNILHVQAENAIQALLNRLTSSEEEVEKK